MEDMIKVDFVIDDGQFVFSDALYLEPDHTFTDAEIEAMKQKRFNDWREYILNPPPYDPSTEITDIYGNDDTVVAGNGD